MTNEIQKSGGIVPDPTPETIEMAKALAPLLALAVSGEMNNGKMSMGIMSEYARMLGKYSPAIVRRATEQACNGKIFRPRPWEIRNECEAILSEIAAKLHIQINSDLLVAAVEEGIEGHNEQKAWMRAEFMRRYGVTESQMQATGYAARELVKFVPEWREFVDESPRPDKLDGLIAGVLKKVK